MKEINDKSIDLDALFEGKSFDLLDSSTQAYVLKEFGSREEYESMSHSFKRIRTVITEEEEMEADAKVKADLMALFEKEDRKVVPLIPKQTGSGLGFLRSPYFQMAVAACLVIVALFFIPWGGSNQDSQLAMADHKEAKVSPEGNVVSPSEGIAADDSSIEPADKAKIDNTENRRSGAGEDVDELAEESPNTESVSKITLEESKPDANSVETPAVAGELEDERKEEIKSISKFEKESSTKNNGPERDLLKDKVTEKDKGNSEVLARATIDSKSKKKAIANSGESKNEDAVNATGGVNTATMPASVNANAPGKKPVNGISLGEKKDLMQFFNTAL